MTASMEHFTSLVSRTLHSSDFLLSLFTVQSVFTCSSSPQPLNWLAPQSLVFVVFSSQPVHICLVILSSFMVLHLPIC